MNSSDLSSPSRILELFSPAAEGNKEPKTLSQLVRLIRGFGVPADGVFINTYFRQEGIIRFFARATADEEITAPLDPEFPIYLYIAGFRRQFSSPSRSKTSLWRPKISPSQTFPVDEL